MINLGVDFILARKDLLGLVAIEPIVVEVDVKIESFPVLVAEAVGSGRHKLVIGVLLLVGLDLRWVGLVQAVFGGRRPGATCR